MKYLYLLAVTLLSLCGCEKKDGPTYGVGEPNFAIEGKEGFDDCLFVELYKSNLNIK